MSGHYIHIKLTGSYPHLLLINGNMQFIFNIDIASLFVVCLVLLFMSSFAFLSKSASGFCCICTSATLDGCLCHMLCIWTMHRAHAAFIGPGDARTYKRFLLIMLWDTRVMRTHSSADKAANLMFWCLNLPSLIFFYEVTNNGWNILSTQKSGTDAHSLGSNSIGVGLKINSMQCQV